MENQSIILILFLVMGLLVKGVKGDVLSVSKITRCETTKADSSDLQCRNKTLVVMAVPTSSNGYSDVIETPIYSLTDDKGVEKYLLSPYNVIITKSKVQYHYPLEYKQNFCGKPYEDMFSIRGCKDHERDEQVACTWAQGNGPYGHLLDSQGFCCNCHGFDHTASHHRMHVTCKSMQIGDKNGSAHCIRFMGPRWYATFAIREYFIDFWIGIKIQMMKANEHNNTIVPTDNILEELTIGPKKLVAISSTRDFIMKLHGDLAGYRPAPMIYDKYLNIPIEDINNPRADLFGWLLIDKGKYTEDGRECDKIGVSYTGFRNQFDRCNRPPQTCLANQLEDYRNEDWRRRDSGNIPLYSVVQYGNVYDGGGLLAIEAPETLDTIITIEINADFIRFKTFKSAGKITKAEVKSFEAFSRNGLMTVEVTNVGEVSADFYLGFVNCSEGIIQPNDQKVSLPVPAVITTLTILLHTTDDKALSRNCTVRLLDAVGDPTDQVTVEFATTSTKYDNKSQNFEGEPIKHNNLTDDDDGWGFPWPFNLGHALGDALGLLGFKDCDECHLPNIICFIWNFCWSELISLISSIVSAVLVGVGIYLLWSSGLLMQFIKLLLLPFRICCCILNRTTKPSNES